MRKTNLKAYSFYDRDKIIWLYHTTETINLFMVKVDKKKKIYGYILSLLLIIILYISFIKGLRLSASLFTNRYTLFLVLVKAT